MPSRTQSLPSRYTDKRRFWQQHVQQQARGKLTQRAYCEQHQLGYASFARWRRLLLSSVEANARADAPSGLVPVQVQPAQALTDPHYNDSEHCVDLVLPNGIRIEGITTANLELATTLVSRL